MTERYDEHFEIYSAVLRESKVFERWFRIASGNVGYFDAWDDLASNKDTHATKQYFALFWQQFDATVVSEEAGNPAYQASLAESDRLVRTLFACDEMPWELLEEQE